MEAHNQADLPIKLKPTAVLTGLCIWVALLSALMLILAADFYTASVKNAFVPSILIAVLIAAGYGAVWLSRYRIIFEPQQITVRKLFSEKYYTYQELNAVIRRGRRSLGARPRAADTTRSMAVLYQGKKTVLELDPMLRPMDGVLQAVQMIKNLDIPKKYL